MVSKNEFEDKIIIETKDFGNTSIKYKGIELNHLIRKIEISLSAGCLPTVWIAIDNPEIILKESKYIIKDGEGNEYEIKKNK